MAKVNKKHAIKFIIDGLEKGLTYSNCYSELSDKYAIPQTSFSRYWKEANLIFNSQQSEIEEELLEVKKQKAKERLLKNIITKEERMVIASDIAKGKKRKINGEDSIPTFADSLRALDYLSKIDGDYATNKQEHFVHIEQPLFGDD